MLRHYILRQTTGRLGETTGRRLPRQNVIERIDAFIDYYFSFNMVDVDAFFLI